MSLTIQSLSSDSSPFDHLSDDCFRKILHKLPSYNSVLRLRRVSKRWLSVISDPCFIHRSSSDDIRSRCDCEPSDTGFYLLIQMTANLGCALIPFRSLQESTFKSPVPRSLDLLFPIFPFRGSRPVACFEDLLLCRTTGPVLQEKLYYIYNLLTKQWLMLPPAPPVRREKVGFICYDRRKFKVVRIPRKKVTEKVTLSIFCSESGTWSESVVLNPPGYYCYFTNHARVVPFDGKLLWTIQPKIFAVYDPLNNDKELCVLRAPTEVCCFGVCKGKLRIATSRRGLPPGLGVIELENLESNWVSKDDIILDRLRNWGLKMEKGNGIEVIAIHPYDENIIYLHVNGHVMLCNTKKQKITYAGDIPKGCMGKRLMIREYRPYLDWHNVFMPVNPCCWPMPLPKMSS